MPAIRHVGLLSKWRHVIHASMSADILVQLTQVHTSNSAVGVGIVPQLEMQLPIPCQTM